MAHHKAEPGLPPCRDNLRGFFQHCFPVLLTRLFGFDDFEASWFTLVAKVQGRLASCFLAGCGNLCTCTMLLKLQSTHPAMFDVCTQQGREEDARALIKLLSPDGV